MAVESAAIVVIILLFCAITARQGKGGTAVAVLPLAITPLAFLVGIYGGPLVDSQINRPILPLLQVGSVMVGALIASLIMGFIASKIDGKNNRMAYLLLCGGFTLILTLLILSSILL